MKITYISHSGFVVELDRHVLIFDYYKGTLPAFDREKDIVVFASHVHHDHFVREIFDWREQYPKIHYVLSSDIRKSIKTYVAEQQMDEKITFLRSNQSVTMGEVHIETLLSTDAGVAFVVQCEDRTIYHAGDLNWWHWEGETEEYNAHMKNAYLREIKKMAKKKIDVAMIPADPRLGEQYYYGIDGFMQCADADRILPMHFWGDATVCEKLMSQKETERYREKIRTIRREGEEICL